MLLKLFSQVGEIVITSAFIYKIASTSCITYHGAHHIVFEIFFHPYYYPLKIY